MVRSMCDVPIKDRKSIKELRKQVRVEPITAVIRGGRLRWYRHVIRENDEDWAKRMYGTELKAEDQERHG